MRHHPRCTVPGCTREAVTTYHLVLTAADHIIAHRAVCADPSCVAVVRRSLDTRVTSEPIKERPC